MLHLPAKVDEAADLLSNLEVNLFTSAKDRRGGARTFLNVNCLYDLFWYIRKFELSFQEQCCVIDYQVQVFLIELVQYRETYSSVYKVVHRVLEEIRSDPCYWVEQSEVYINVAKLKSEKLDAAAQAEKSMQEDRATKYVANGVDQCHQMDKTGKKGKGKKTSTIIENEKGVVKGKKRGRKPKYQNEQTQEDPTTQDTLPENQRPEGSTPKNCTVEEGHMSYEHRVTIKTAKAEIGILKPDEALTVYKRYIDRCQSVFPSSVMRDVHTFDSSLVELRSAIVPRDEATISQVNMVTQGFLKEVKKVKNVVSSENRYTRNMRKTTKSEDYERLKYEYENDPEGLGKRLQIDIMESMPLNYEERILFNPKYFPYSKLKLVLLPRVYSFLLKSAGLSDTGDFGLIFQNCLLFLNQSASPIETYSSDTKICKGLGIEQLADQLEVKSAKHILKFSAYCRETGFSIEDNLEKVLSTRKVQLAFLENMLRFGRVYLRLHQRANYSSYRPHRTYGNLEKSKERSRISLSGPEKSRYLGKLETIYHLNKGLAHDLATYFYKTNEGRMTSSSRETLHQYGSMIEKRMKVVSSKDPECIDYLSKAVHSNIYEDRHSEIRAIKLYQDYIEHPETKDKQSYKFYGEKLFKLPISGYKKFAEAYLRWHTKQVINNKIAEEVGSGVSVSQVRHLKHKFVKELAKRAARLNVTLKDQLVRELANFDFDVMFSWLSKDNIAN